MNSGSLCLCVSRWLRAVSEEALGDYKHRDTKAQSSQSGNIRGQIQVSIRESEDKAMNNITNWLLNPPTNAPRATILIRLMAGSVVLWEGILKFVYTNQGVGRFTKLGFPAPHFTATADAWLEIVGGTLLVAGLMTRLIAVPFMIEMLVAMASTKIPLYLGTS